MYQNQNGISICFPKPKFSTELGPCFCHALVSHVHFLVVSHAMVFYHLPTCWAHGLFFSFHIISFMALLEALNPSLVRVANARLVVNLDFLGGNSIENVEFWKNHWSFSLRFPALGAWRKFSTVHTKRRALGCKKFLPCPA